MKKAVLYLRVSSKEQMEGSSIETQERICTDYALRNEYEIDRIFTEKGESAKTADRTELKALLDYVSKYSKNLEAAIIYKIDRLARNTLDHAQLKLFFNKFGIKLVSATENLEDTPVGRLIENQLAGFAQFDNEIRAERCKIGMMAAVKAGRYVWKAPIGYKNTGGKGTSNLVLDTPKTVKLVRKTWEYIDTGYAPEEARKAITKDGLRGASGKPVSKSNFHRLIRNKVYIGIIEKFGLSVVGNFKPLVAYDLFQRVQEKLQKNGKNMPVYKIDNEDFPLRGLVTCSQCNQRMTASWSKGRSQRYAYYRCKFCRRVNLKRDDLESNFIKLLKEHSYKSELKEMLIEAIEANLEYRAQGNKIRVNELEKQILQLKAKEKQIVEKNFGNVINDNLAKELLEENEQQISEATLELHQHTDSRDDVMKVVKHSLSVLEDISGVWLAVDLDIKKRFQKFLFPHGLPYDGSNFGTTRLAYCIEKKWSSNPQQFLLVGPEGIEPSSSVYKTPALPLSYGPEQMRLYQISTFIFLKIVSKMNLEILRYAESDSATLRMTI